MKIVKVGLIVLLPICLFGAGCPVTPPSPLVGSWEGTRRSPSFPLVPDETVKATFNADGTATLLQFPGVNAGSAATLLVNYSTSGNQLTIVTTSLFGTVVDTFSISGNTLTVTGGSDTVTLTKQ
ncbi:MAG: hypothetical protein HZA51_00405 [Planctomycetes bacterium]|nr:hypothetical protein [Planctomycetota bacterium]